MANYEPLNPQVIGFQWSPIRQESISFDLGTELGYTFSVTGGSGTINEPRVAEWALSHFPSSFVRGQTPFVSIYRRGEETNIGRIERIIVPVATFTVTGATGSVFPANNAFDNAYDDIYYTLDPGNSEIRFQLDGLTTSLQNALQNRRILKLNLLYTASGAFNELDNETSGVYAALRSPNEIWSFGLGSITGPLNQQDNVSFQRVNLGDVNPFWAGSDPYAQSDKYPWRYEEIDRMTETGGTPKFFLAIFGQNIPTLTNPIIIHYAALEVIACDETRIRYGGNSIGRLDSESAAFDLLNETTPRNTINLRTTSFQTTGALPAGDYSVTITLADSGDVYNRGDKPRFSAIRQVDAMPAPGVQGILVTKWQDPDGLPEVNAAGFGPSQYYFPGNFPTSQESDILPGIGLHAVDQDPQLNESAPHTFYLLRPAPVLDDTIVRQGIINDSKSAQAYYPWVRFYARRLGTNSRTLRIRALSGVPSIATISQEEFDVLPEIVDGWREVTLRFDSNTPSFSNDGSIVQWEWDTINGSVSPQNQWEIAVAGSAAIGTSFTTYGRGITGAFARYNDIFVAPEGEQDFVRSDAVLMFSQDPIAVSGLAIETLSQEVTGIGLECSTLPECIPTGIAYHHVTWNAGNIVCDTFSREVTGGWNGTDTGQTYTTTGGSDSDYAVADGVGTLTIAAGTGSRRTVLNGINQQDPTLYATFSINQTPVGGNLTLGFTARGTDSNNQYVLSARCGTDGSITALIERVVAGSFTNIGSAVVPNISFFAGQTYSMRARLEGSLLRLRIWEEGAVEPTVWHATAVDTTYTSGTVSGFRANVAGGYTGSYPVIFSVDNFMTSEVTVAGCTYELQRSDDVDTDWHTIMVSSDLCPIDFNDYEARVGVESRYRIRLVNALRFTGPWSSEVASTLTDPGVFGIGDGNSVLIFTSNETQSGSSNLAYVMSWDRSVEEDFVFPEANTVQLQPMYQRDFFVAFHPTERGGEQFSRTLLVNNAMVSTERVRDGFRSLRDMAWDDLSYVCVRNELGDRWFAAVIVPSGTIQRNRRLYLARVDIAEVTDTPTEVIISPFGVE
jgi:hypothetical protein